MKTVKMIFFDDVISLIKNFFALTIVVGICFLPALYAWFNIYSNWDPYANTGALKIAAVSLDEGFRERYEPHAALLTERLSALRTLHEAGCKTWVSIEPYPTPNIIQQDLKSLLDAVGFTDRIIFGRMNYNKTVTEYRDHKSFFNACAATVADFCRERSIALHIKDGTITE